MASTANRNGQRKSGSAVVENTNRTAFFKFVKKDTTEMELAERRICATASEAMQYIARCPRCLLGQPVSHSPIIVQSIFQLLVRGREVRDIARFMGVTEELVLTVKKCAYKYKVKITAKECEFPEAFSDEETGKRISCIEYERRTLAAANKTADAEIENNPYDEEEENERCVWMLEALFCKPDYYIFVPTEGLYYAGTNNGGHQPIWTTDISLAKRYTTYSGCSNQLDAMLLARPRLMRGAVIVGRDGKEVFEEERG